MGENANDYPYVTRLDLRYGPLEIVDVPALDAACTDAWYNQTLCRVNGSVVRLGIIKGEYHWHKHDDEDELFYVHRGLIRIQVKDQPVIILEEGQLCVIPKGAEHKPGSYEPSVVLMFEPSALKSTGD